MTGAKSELIINRYSNAALNLLACNRKMVQTIDTRHNVAMKLVQTIVIVQLNTFEMAKNLWRFYEPSTLKPTWIWRTASSRNVNDDGANVTLATLPRSIIFWKTSRTRSESCLAPKNWIFMAVFAVLQQRKQKIQLVNKERDFSKWNETMFFFHFK